MDQVVRKVFDFPRFATWSFVKSVTFSLKCFHMVWSCQKRIRLESHTLNEVCGRLITKATMRHFQRSILFRESTLQFIEWKRLKESEFYSTAFLLYTTFCKCPHFTCVSLLFCWFCWQNTSVMQKPNSFDLWTPWCFLLIKIEIYFSGLFKDLEFFLLPFDLLRLFSVLILAQMSWLWKMCKGFGFSSTVWSGLMLFVYFLDFDREPEVLLRFFLSILSCIKSSIISIS